MKSTSVQWIVGLVAVAIVIQIVRPSRTNPPVVPSRSLEAHVQVPVPVQEVLQRACYNCHSSATVWPWYSQVAPVSWLIADDVNTARGHVNMQDWEAQVSPQEGAEHLGLICKLIRNGTMPPLKYRLMHKEARITTEEADQVCAWSQKFAVPEDSDKKAD